MTSMIWTRNGPDGDGEEAPPATFSLASAKFRANLAIGSGTPSRAELLFFHFVVKSGAVILLIPRIPELLRK